MPVKPIEGDSYPLGALPVGTTICLVQWYPDTDVVKVGNPELTAYNNSNVGVPYDECGHFKNGLIILVKEPLNLFDRYVILGYLVILIPLFLSII